jgi:hypothetical protein
MRSSGVLMATPALAVTVDNQSGTIAIDYGNEEEVKTVGANKSVRFDCKDGCGLSGSSGDSPGSPPATTPSPMAKAW